MEILHLCLVRGGCMVLSARSPHACFELLQRGHLVRTEECRCGQSSRHSQNFMRTWLTIIAVWCRIRSWSLSNDIRLGSDSLHWIAIAYAVVGCCQCSWWSDPSHVDYSTYPMYVRLGMTVLTLQLTRLRLQECSILLVHADTIFCSI